MKLAVLGDVHLISDADPYKGLHPIRQFFKDGLPSFTRLLGAINDESPDATILLGDLVDWVSDENIGLGLDTLSRLKMPWYSIPGNHDFERPIHGYHQDVYAQPGDRRHREYWQTAGVTFQNQCLPFGDFHLVLIDNALSTMTTSTETWLKATLQKVSRPLLFAHVPLDFPETRDYILSVDPHRDMNKYVADAGSCLPLITENVSHILSGHLHFSGTITSGSTIQHLCGMRIHAMNRCEASALLLEFDGLQVTIRELGISG